MIFAKKLDILQNDPIATINYKGNEILNISFKDINYENGYYLIKGNNVDDISYYYFYDLVNVVNRLGPFKTNNSELFKIETKSDEYYSVFTTPGNPDKKNIYIFKLFYVNLLESKNHIFQFSMNTIQKFFLLML